LTVVGLSVLHEPIDEDVDLLHVCGFIDAHTFKRFESTVGDLFARGRYRLIVDMAGVSYVSSAGAGVLVAAASEAEENGGRLVVLDAREAVMAVLRLLGVTRMLTIKNDREEALTAVRGP
jgi:anti-anti-sigma factor